MPKIQTADPSSKDKVLELLKRDPISNGLAIQDLQLWFENSKFHYCEQPFSYLHISGHPAHANSTIISFGGDQSVTSELLSHVKPQAPFTARETDKKYAA
ncbi:MAG: hypothetical protein AAB250_10040, partial [Bdellovibrionota bacterium]